MFRDCVCSLSSHHKTKNDFAEMVTVSNCYLIINSFLKKWRINVAVVANMSSSKNSWSKNANEKGKKIFVPYLKCFLFEQDSWKNNIFYKKQVESEHVLKYFENLGYWENLLLLLMLNEASVYLCTLGNNIYTSKNSPTFIWSSSAIATLKKLRNTLARHQKDILLFYW